MTKNNGPTTTESSTSSLTATPGQWKFLTGTSTTSDQFTTLTHHGSSGSDHTIWVDDTNTVSNITITDVGNSSLTAIPPKIVSAPVFDSAQIYKTAEGEFILMGDNAQAILMEYFLKSPEMWLKLAAMKGELEDG